MRPPTPSPLPQAYYEEYVSKLHESNRKEREKDDKALASMAESGEWWAKWVSLLSAAARRIQTMSDAGDEGANAVVSTSAWVASASEGGGDAESGAAQGTDARLASLLVDVAAKGDTRLSAMRYAARMASNPCGPLPPAAPLKKTRVSERRAFGLSRAQEAHQGP